MSLRSLPRGQHGITLITTLVMLIMLTLFALTAMRLANINLRITGNYQWQKDMEMKTDSALEQLLSSATNFDDSAVQAGTATVKDICTDGTLVATGTCALTNPPLGTVSVPRCTGGQVASGYTKKLGELAPDDNDWLLKATATDSTSGAKVTIYRGVTVRMLAGNCPDV